MPERRLPHRRRALIILLSCAWPLLVGAPPHLFKGAPGNAAQSAMSAPFFALEPTSRPFTPAPFERRVGGVPLLGGAFMLFLGWRAARSFVPASSPQRKPNLILFQQLRLEGG